MNRMQLIVGRLAEECAEVAQLASKIQQYGFDDIKPGITKSNRQRLHDELNDILGVVAILNGEFDLDFTPNQEAITNKKERIDWYAKRSKKCGLLTD